MGLAYGLLTFHINHEVGIVGVKIINRHAIQSFNYITQRSVDVRACFLQGEQS